ncbi:alpha-2,8-polysialyltransferase family protein [Streptomyces sp. NBC_00620]|uniref:alpha-2,8-polysialyltransferase family protein n=1 Tax=unclassified Streptomyces TaxID=2593676 RepID=UPI002251B9D7|nr:alpha-2,8-polysialyltransferase family protein [Streptomyces sp. NBC_00620]MCX4971903.1 alpha-2,8-polysialyltransferase family protein [Streptomyces sp. NBC_00620]WTB38791.1 alpha-2,8-polysialyltransferase family protein [Streptomyces sp. NBC_00827]WUC13568.1 alpha-2,8-polysialyltransferase family protein [Streptomyces sp. NBC_00564]WUC49926.1 alpha-2,8-polysialyltransferase family protein [Streptomyces sp. NBC_00554]
MSRTTQIFCASTLYGAATLAAAIESDQFTAADRRLLLVFNNSTTPETTPAVDEMPGFASLSDHFDGVLSWNEAIRPFHPGAWTPRTDDIPLFERYLRLLWDLGDDRVELVLESIQVTPAFTVAQLFTGAPIDVYADGLMSYGPTRNKLDPLVGTRVRRLLHLDLVPGLTPLLLTEFDVPAEIVPADAFLKVLSGLGGAVPELPALPDNAALLLGQYLSALNILSAKEEEDLHVRMMRGAVDRGHRSIVFKPHPTAPASYSRALETEAAKLGVELTVLNTPVLAEVLFEKARPALVVGCFSTALFTASVFYDLPVARIGTEPILDRLTPYQNSNRVPVALADALLPDLEGKKDNDALPTDELNGLVVALGFTMQPQIHPRLRPATERYLSQHFGPRTQRYFKRRRLTSLGLPGGIPERLAFVPRNSTARRVVRQARALRKAVRR